MDSVEQNYKIDGGFLTKLKGFKNNHPNLFDDIEFNYLEGMDLDVAIVDFPEISELLERVFRSVAQEIPEIGARRVKFLKVRLKTIQGKEAGQLAARLGHILFACGNFEEALDAYNLAHFHAPNDADVLFKLGISYLKLEKKWEDGIPLLERVLKLNPNDIAPEGETKAYACFIGDIVFNFDIGLAESFYEFAFDIDNKFAPAITGLADCALEEGKNSDSLSLYQLAESLDRNSARTKLGLARWHNLNGNKKECLNYLKECWKLDPTDAEIWVEMGNSYLRYKLLLEAKKSFERAIQIDNKNEAAILSLFNVKKMLPSLGGVSPLN